MKELIIIGAGGMGRTIFDMARECMGYGEKFVIKGFLDDDSKALDGFKGYPPILGSIKDYEIQPKDVFTWSMGNIQSRKRCCEAIISRGGEFITLIHNTVRLGTNAKWDGEVSLLHSHAWVRMRKSGISYWCRRILLLLMM